MNAVAEAVDRPLAAASRATWRVEVHDSIEPLRAHWLTIEEHGCCTLFQSYDWLSVWYEVTTRHGLAEPVIVTASREGVAGPEVILPLCRLQHGFYSEITFADILVSDFSGPVFMPDALPGPREMRDLWKQVVKALPKADIVRLAKLSGDVGGGENPLLGLRGVVRFPYCLWGIELDGAPGELPSGVPEQQRASTEKRRAALARKFTRSATWHEDPEVLPRLFDELVDLRLRRSERIGRDEILLEPAWRDFYETLVARSMMRARPIITRLQVNGDTIATVMSVGYGRAVHYLMPSFLMKKWSRYTPGFQMIFDAMEGASAHGYGYFDFTIGDEPYKQAFGATARPLYELRVPRSPRGCLLYLAWRMKRVWRASRRWTTALRTSATSGG